MVAGFVLAMGAQLYLKGQADLSWRCADFLLPLGADCSSLEKWSRVTVTSSPLCVEGRY